jgi:hypothetical protein
MRCCQEGSKRGGEGYIEREREGAEGGRDTFFRTLLIYNIDETISSCYWVFDNVKVSYKTCGKGTVILSKNTSKTTKKKLKTTFRRSGFQSSSLCIELRVGEFQFRSKPNRNQIVLTQRYPSGVT